MSSVTKLNMLGQSIWYDNIRRSLIEDGTLGGMIERREIFGVTSNPSIFQKAIANSQDYDDDLQTMSLVGVEPQEIFYRLAIKDIQDVADLFLPMYRATGGGDGFVSLEVNPNLANDTEGTIAEAKMLWRVVNRPNLMIKIPATKAGLPAITAAIAAGINVNVTLIFSRKRYLKVMDAYLKGLEKRLGLGKPISDIASVASFFVSRLETKVDDRLDEMIASDGDKAETARSLKGKLAVANTRLAYQDYKQFFSTPRFEKVAEAGGQKQRPLWASTSTKDPAYRDVKYVEELVAENTVNTIPPKTLKAFLDHGQAALTIEDKLDEAEQNVQMLESLGIDLDEITQVLEEEGVRKFADSFGALMDAIETRQQEFVNRLGPLTGVVQTAFKNLMDADVVSRLHRIDPTLWTADPAGQAEIQKRLGWLSLPENSQILIPDLQAFTAQCREDGFEKILLLGMGGSSLAPETLSLILADQTDGLELRILDSTLPGQIEAAEAWVDYEKTLFIVASKSGTTSETMAFFAYFWKQAGNLLGETRCEHFVAVTDPGSHLAEIGSSHNFRAVFTSNPNVGGRYSALTYFGLLSAALLGVDLQEYLTLASQMAVRCAPANDLVMNPGAVLGVVIGAAAKAGWDKLTLLADPTVAPLSAWLAQLIAESSGKEGKGIVPVAYEPLEAPSVYGKDRLFVYLRHTVDFDPNVEALVSASQPVLVLDIKDLISLGAAFYRWEFAIAVACSLLGVNAFDQPDVQDNKTRTKNKLKVYQETGKLEAPEVIWENDGIKVYGRAFDGMDEADSLDALLAAFANLTQDGDYIAINAYVPRNIENEEKLTVLRKNLLTRTGCATTLGFGPRFLHSTGQMHKGGPNTGLFLQITREEDKDYQVPGKAYSFGILARAQALGDLEALLARGRRAIRIHLPAGATLDFE